MAVGKSLTIHDLKTKTTENGTETRYGQLCATRGFVFKTHRANVQRDYRPRSRQEPLKDDLSITNLKIMWVFLNFAAVSGGWFCRKNLHLTVGVRLGPAFPGSAGNPCREDGWNKKIKKRHTVLVVIGLWLRLPVDDIPSRQEFSS